MIGFFSTFKEVIYVVLIAAATVRRSLDIRIWVFGIIAGGVIIWMSLVWSVVKFDYRPIMSGMSTSERATYIVGKYVDGVDYDEALQQLLERLQYTTFFGDVLAYDDAGLLNRTETFYWGAIQHVSMPRVIFPNKAILSDSGKTSELLGISIGEDTSIGIGFVAEAYADFGFPAMLLPMLMIGMLHGIAVKYFMTRRAPILVREALAVAAFFLSFSIATNIDKALGGFLTNWLALGVALRFGYPFVASWFFRPLQRQGGRPIGRAPGARQ
jgi:hypothetical protein